MLKDRYSVRGFKDIPVEQNKLDKILQAGILAPTAKNSQLQRFKVLVTPADLGLVDQCTPCRYGAPAVILICGIDNGNDWGKVGAVIATTAMMYQAWDLGIGSCWVQNFDADKTIKVFNLPEGLDPIAFLPIGYAREDMGTSRYHGVRKSIEEYLI